MGQAVVERRAAGALSWKDGELIPASMVVGGRSVAPQEQIPDCGVAPPTEADGELTITTLSAR